MPGITLNFINRSNDTNNSQIVIFQKNSTDPEAPAIAWTVIKNCGRDFTHPVVFPLGFEVAAKDSFGNISPKLPANNGYQFNFVLEPSGHALKPVEQEGNAEMIIINNDLAEGAINAGVYYDGRLLAAAPDVVPGEKASFGFKPTIWVGVVSQLEEGATINAAIASQIDTEISLLGIRSADVVMTGGGSGPETKPFMFSLENVLFA